MRTEITRSYQRGRAEFGWLHANHYFSFGSYYNPNKMGFGKLRVINDDSIDPGTGFDTHPHKNMEIITIPLEGGVQHRDSAGNHGVIKKGEVQVMSAGRGIFHSEHNASISDQLKLFQIWIEPNEINVEPRYDQKTFSYHDFPDQWTQLVSPMSRLQEEGLKIHQEAYINISPLSEEKTIEYKVKEKGNGLYMLVAEGMVMINGQKLEKRDSIAIADVDVVAIQAQVKSEVLVIEVPLA